MTGKIAGFIFGFLLTRNIIGGLVGVYVGHLFDKAMANLANKHNVEQWLNSDDSKQSIFFYTTFSVMGHVAKAAGKVTPEHIQTATQFMEQMRLSPQQQQEAKDAFREGKLLGFPLKKKLDLFKRHFGKRVDLCQFFIEIQIQTAYSDALLEQAEYDLLKNIAKQLGFSKRSLQKMIAMWEAELRFQQYKQQQYRQHSNHQQQSHSHGQKQPPPANQLADAYALLGVGERDGSREIKRAYKRLMAQHHPDKLIAKGLPPEMMEVAKQKTQDIQAAYEIIKQARKL